MKNIASLIRKLNREIKKNYPGISDETATEGTKTLFILVADFKLDDDGSDTWALFDAKIGDLASEDGNEWATEMVNTRIERARPFYDKAIATGADPVPVLQVTCNLSEQAACDIVNTLSNETTPASIPAPAADPFATNEEQKDEENEEQYA